MRRALALVLVVLAAAPARAQSSKAYSYDFQLDEGSRTHDVTRGTVRVSGDRARVDVESNEADREYFILTDGGKTLYVVHPDRRTIDRHDGDAFASIVGTGLRAASPVVQFTMKDFTIDTTHYGEGGTVAGRHTMRSGLSEHWRLDMRAMGIVHEEMGGSAEATYWTDPTLTLMRNPLYDIVSSAMYAMAASDRKFSSASLAARRSLLHGALLKADISYAMKDGDHDREHLRYEVTRITPGAVDEKLFTLPKDFRIETPTATKVRM